jgi:hypothetical protein
MTTTRRGIVGVFAGYAYKAKRKRKCPYLCMRRCLELKVQVVHTFRNGYAALTWNGSGSAVLRRFKTFPVPQLSSMSISITTYH